MRKTVGEGPKWAVGSEARGREEVSRSPGPGQYDMRRTKDGPQWAMGTGKRVDLVKGGDAPGPGGYSPVKGADGPSYSMSAKMATI